MDACMICCESPCTCPSTDVESKVRTRASRRLPVQPTPAPIRKPVRKFSSTPTGVRASEPVEESVEVFSSDGGTEDRLLYAAIMCLAPLMSDAELKRHIPEVASLEARRAKFRADVGVWSDARYG